MPTLPQMDFPDALVALAHMKLRLERLTRNPSLIEESPMAAPIAPVIPAPIALAGLKARLTRAKGLEGRAAAAGTRVDSALDIIETGVSALEKHAPRLEQYGGDLMDTINSLLEGGNGGPPLDGIEEEPVTPVPTPPPAPSTTPPVVPGPNGGPRILNSAGV